MLKFNIHQIGKKYNYRWVFKNINLEFQQGYQYAILGNNGSGKSTFLKLISGFCEPDEGHLTLNEEPFNHENFREINFSAPYIDIIEDFTFREVLNFHSKFRSFRDGHNVSSIIECTGLRQSCDFSIKNYSSGMKQRVKLALSLFYDCKINLFDEPGSHLDIVGLEWFHYHVNECKNQIVVIASNSDLEYKNTQYQYNIGDFKH